jgi:hypothetical protein
MLRKSQATIESTLNELLSKLFTLKPNVMRNELENIEIIEKYLRGELTIEERASFEEQLKTDVKLQKEVELQKDVVKGVERLGVKQTIQKSYKSYKLGKSGLNFGLGAIVLVGVVSAFLWYSNSNKADASVLPEFNENGGKDWADADKYLESQKFTINTSADTVIETEGGIVMYVPAGSFLDDKGNEVTGEVEFEVKEALNTEQILQAGLSSMSGDKLLESAGMFYVNARKDGKTVHINPDKGIYTEVPTDKVKPNMQLFEGQRMTDGSIDWINPTPLEKFLTPVDINSLDFYPPKYESKLTELKQNVSDKKYKDSLYYSFAWENENKNNDCLRLKQIYIGDSKYGPKRINGKLLSMRDNFDFYWTLDEVSCNVFDLSCIIGTSDSIITDVFQIKDFDNSKCEFIGTNKVSNRYDENKMNRFNDKKLTNTKVITQRLKMRSMGQLSFRMDIVTKVIGENEESDGFLTCAVIMDKQQKKCNGPFLKNQESNYVVTEIDSIPKSTDFQQICGINPAKIKAIWSEEFNNTLISTREFEERLPSIFGTCNDKVLDLYINNINLDMYVIDSMAANMSSGLSKDEFLAFASRKDGKVQIDEQRVKKLQKHYEQKQKLIAEAIAKTQRKFEEENARLDKEVDETRNKFSENEIKRKQDNYVQEFNLNLTDAYRQLGRPKPERLDAAGIYRLTLKSGGWKNVDAYVMESLNNRETLDYTDPTTGKKAIIKYESITVSIKDEVKFDRLFVYVLPDKLNSFMKMKKEENKFTEKLNELMTHNLVCLGYVGEQAYFYSLDGVAPKDYKDIDLKPLSQSELKHNLNRYDNTQRKNLLKDFDYQLFEVKEKIRQDKLEERRKFREEIMSVIFPCEFLPKERGQEENY